MAQYRWIAGSLGKSRALALTRNYEDWPYLYDFSIKMLMNPCSLIPDPNERRVEKPRVWSRHRDQRGRFRQQAE